MSLNRHWGAANALAELLDGQDSDARGRLEQLTGEQLDAVQSAARRLSGLCFDIAEWRRVQARSEAG